MKNPNEHIDYFNQPIRENSKLMASVGSRLHLCSVVKLNKKTIIVKKTQFKDGAYYRVDPINTIVITEEDLTVLSLNGKIPCQ